MVVQLDLLSRSLAETDSEVHEAIAAALRPSAGADDLAALRARVARLADQYPLYQDLTAPGLTAPNLTAGVR